MTKKISLIFFLFVQLKAEMFGQDPGIWAMYFGNSNIRNTPWQIHSELQLRNKNLINKSEQLLLRSGIIYKFKENNSLGLGYAFLMNYDGTELFLQPDNTENRIWQQFINRNKINRVNLEHRYRIEQRWKENEYSNRIRYRLQITIPLNKQNIEKGTILINMYDEIFLEFDNTPYDRNRFYTAFGYQFNKNSQIQLGYLSQYVNQTNFNYMQLGIFMNH
jgi:long-subunit fatty acid transport protein